MSYDSSVDTLKHKQEVSKFINRIIVKLLNRSSGHDDSKLESPEKEIFDIYTPKLRDTTYGSEEYKSYLEEMQIALNHHYMVNSHHPEHNSDGIAGMDLVDLIEMFLDWWAATRRHADGDILKSIEHNQTRFGYSDDVKSIFINTVKRW